MAKTRELTDLQKSFLYHLVGEAHGDFHKAKVLAGYAETTPVAEIVRSLRDEIIDAAKDILVVGVPKAAAEIVAQVYDPSRPGASISMKAAQEILDRVGVVKATGDIQLKVPEGGLVILPAKQVNPFEVVNEQNDELPSGGLSTSEASA